MSQVILLSQKPHSDFCSDQKVLFVKAFPEVSEDQDLDMIDALHLLMVLSSSTLSPASVQQAQRVLPVGGEVEGRPALVSTVCFLCQLQSA